MQVSEMTHDDIAEWCASRLNGMGYKHSFANMTSASHGEQPDVLGITSYGKSILVEVKVSRSDFRADFKKPWRKDGAGIGDVRVYLVPEGLVNVDEVPYGWQLWEIYGKSRPKLRVVKGRVKKRIKTEWGVQDKHSIQNMTLSELQHFEKRGDKNYREELTWVLKILDRATKDGIDVKKYSNNYRK